MLLHHSLYVEMKQGYIPSQKALWATWETLDAVQDPVLIININMQLVFTLMK